MTTPVSPDAPEIAFEQPLFHSDRIAADWGRMRGQITSSTELEAAYKALQPQVAELGIQLSDEEADQLLEFYNAVVADGRYIGEMITDPSGVAERLKLQISDNAAAAIRQAGTIDSLRAERGVAAAAAPIVVIAVVIVIVFGPKKPKRKRVIDASGIVKL